MTKGMVSAMKTDEMKANVRTYVPDFDMATEIMKSIGEARKYRELEPLLKELKEEVRCLNGYLRFIAHTHKSNELEEEFLEDACFKTGFDDLVEQARESVFARNKAANITTQIATIMERNDGAK